VLAAADFEFRVGNTDPGNTNAWLAAPPPQAIGVRRGAGVDGSDRVTITWRDEDPATLAHEAGSIAGQWLEVRVKAGPATGLSADDVFYFGNLIGDSGAGNSSTLARTDATDVKTIQKNFRAKVGVANPYDINKDGRVDAADAAIAAGNPATGANGLRLLRAPTLTALLDASTTVKLASTTTQLTAGSTSTVSKLLSGSDSLRLSDL
jgi:hypothetical protein